MTIRGILFDKDGTLLDFTATWVPVIHEAARAAAGSHDHLVERLLAVGGWDAALGRVSAGSLLAAGTTEEIAAAWAVHLPGGAEGGPSEAEEDLVALLDRVFQEGGARHATPVTALAPLFARLKHRGLKLGVATSDSIQGARASLAGFEVLEVLDFLAGYDSGHGAKPGPGMVRAFCSASGLSSNEIAVVGDNLHDLEMGRAADAGLVVGVLTGNGEAGDLSARADAVLNSISELESLLDRL